MKLSQRSLAALLLATLVLAGCEKPDSVVVLQLGHGLDQSHPVQKAMIYMRNRLSERSNGRLEMVIVPNGSLGSEQEMIEMVRRGDLPLVKVSAANLERLVPLMGVFGIPYLFSDSKHYWEVLDGPIGRDLLLAGEEHGLVGLCFYDAGGRSFYTRDRPVTQPSDLVGLKIRVMDSSMAVEMVEALGGEPAPLDWSELTTALREGVVDGAENNAPSFFTSRHYETCRFYSLDEHTMIPDVLLIGTEVWNALSPDLQRIVRESAEESSRYQRELWTEDSREKLDLLQKHGVEITRPDKSLFKEATLPMYASYSGTPIGELIEAIRSGD